MTQTTLTPYNNNHNGASLFFKLHHKVQTQHLQIMTMMIVLLNWTLIVYLANIDWIIRLSKSRFMISQSGAPSRSVASLSHCITIPDSNDCTLYNQHHFVSIQQHLFKKLFLNMTILIQHHHNPQ